MTAPLTPRDCDLRDFPRMMIDIPRLFASEFDATDNDTAWRYGVTLWMRSFHQVPAASLPDDDRQLAKLCGLGRDVATWKAIREEALRGWTKADDGLLYHSVVAEMALECWLEKLAQRLSSGAGNAKRWKGEFDPAPIESDIAIGADCLERLNPKSRALLKMRRRKSPPDIGGNEPGSGRDADSIPSGSQGEGKGREKEETAIAVVVSAEPKATIDDVRRAFDAYNALAARLGLPKARSLDDGRRKAIRARLNDGGLEAWTQALAAVEASPHCRGENDRSWRADLDFICQPRSWRRLLEGAYGGKLALRQQAPTAPTSRFTGPPDVREDIRTCIGRGDDVVRYELDRCGWRDLPARTIVAPNAVVADKLKNAVGWRLRELGIGIEVGRKAA